MLVKSGSQWLLGAKLTQADAQAAKALAGLKPNPASHPNLFFWASMVTKFSEAASGKWPAGDLPQPAVAAKEEKKVDKKPAPKKAAPAAAAEDDEFDPFADDGDDAGAAEAAANLKKKGE